MQCHHRTTLPVARRTVVVAAIALAKLHLDLVSHPEAEGNALVGRAGPLVPTGAEHVGVAGGVPAQIGGEAGADLSEPGVDSGV